MGVTRFSRCFVSQFPWLGKRIPFPLALPRWGDASPCFSSRWSGCSSWPAPIVRHSLVRWPQYLSWKCRNHWSSVSLALGVGDWSCSYSAILLRPPRSPSNPWSCNSELKFSASWSHINTFILVQIFFLPLLFHTINISSHTYFSYFFLYTLEKYYSSLDYSSDFYGLHFDITHLGLQEHESNYKSRRKEG